MNLELMAARAKTDRRQLNWAGLIYCQLGHPVVFYGSFGIGKTTMANAIAKLSGRYYANLSLSQVDAEAITGYLSPSSEEVNGKTIRFVEMLPLKQIAMCTAVPSVLLLDELGSVDERKQAAALKLLCSEEGEFEDCWMIGAANPPDIAANGHDLTLPATNRLMVLDWEFDREAHQEGSRNRQNYPDPIIPIVPPREKWEANLDYWGFLKAAFVDGGGRLTCDSEGEYKLEEGKPFATPRSWTFFEQFGAAAMSVGATNATIDKGMDGLLGPEVAGMFREFIEKQDLPDPDSILRDPRAYRLPHRSDLARATLSALGNKLEQSNNPADWEACRDFIEANYAENREWMQMWISHFFQKKPADYTPQERTGVWRDLIHDRMKIQEASV